MSAAAKVLGDPYLLTHIFESVGPNVHYLVYSQEVNRLWNQESIRILWRSVRTHQFELLIRLAIDSNQGSTYGKFRAQQLASICQEIVLDKILTLPSAMFKSLAKTLIFKRLTTIRTFDQYSEGTLEHILDAFDPVGGIKLLDLYYAGPQELRYIAVKCTQLDELIIFYNMKKDVGNQDISLAEILDTNRSLRSLRLEQWNFAKDLRYRKRLSQALAKHPSLESLFLNGGHFGSVGDFFTYSDVEQSNSFPKLQALDTEFGADSSTYFQAHFGSIKRLYLRLKDWSTDLTESVFTYKNLTHLVLKPSDETMVQGDDLLNIAERCTNIIHLEVLAIEAEAANSYYMGYTDVHIKRLVTSLPHLEVLMIWSNAVAGLTVRSLRDVNLSCPRIRMLQFWSDLVWEDELYKTNFSETVSEPIILHPFRHLEYLRLCTESLYFTQSRHKPGLWSDGRPFECNLPLLKTNLWWLTTNNDIMEEMCERAWYASRFADLTSSS